RAEEFAIGDLTKGLTNKYGFETQFNIAKDFGLISKGTGLLIGIEQSKTKFGLFSSTGLKEDTFSLNYFRYGSGQISSSSQIQNLVLNLQQGQIQQQGFNYKFNPNTFSSNGFSFPSKGFDLNFPGLPSLGGYAIPNPKPRKGKKASFNIAPSFTGIVENLKI